MEEQKVLTIAFKYASAEKPSDLKEKWYSYWRLSIAAKCIDSLLASETIGLNMGLNFCKAISRWISHKHDEVVNIDSFILIKGPFVLCDQTTRHLEFRTLLPYL
jgi:hypothetical protein